jgi:hypothetical protein
MKERERGQLPRTPFHLGISTVTMLTETLLRFIPEHSLPVQMSM